MVCVGQREFTQLHWTGKQVVSDTEYHLILELNLNFNWEVVALKDVSRMCVNFNQFGMIFNFACWLNSRAICKFTNNTRLHLAFPHQRV